VTTGGIEHPVASGSGEEETWRRERHLWTRVRWHFSFFTTDGMSVFNHSWIRFQPITDLY